MCVVVCVVCVCVCVYMSLCGVWQGFVLCCVQCGAWQGRGGVWQGSAGPCRVAQGRQDLNTRKAGPSLALSMRPYGLFSAASAACVY